MAPEYVLPVVPVQELKQLEPTQDDVVDQEEVPVTDVLGGGFGRTVGPEREEGVLPILNHSLSRYHEFSLPWS